VDKALALQPQSVRALVLKADLLADQLALGKIDTPARWAAVRALLARANRLDTEDQVPLFRWYESYVRQGTPPDTTARNGLYKAFLLAPEVAELRVELAFSLADQQRFDEAVALVEFLANDPHHAKFGASVLEQLKKMRDAARPATPAATPSSPSGGAG
jgi:hypothetical protein